MFLTNFAFLCFSVAVLKRLKMERENINDYLFCPFLGLKLPLFYGACLFRQRPAKLQVLDKQVKKVPFFQKALKLSFACDIIIYNYFFVWRV